MAQKYQKILVPVDGSDSAERALERAIAIAKRNAAHLDILNVIDVKHFASNVGGVIDPTGDIIYSTFENVQSYLKELEEKVLKTGYKDVSIHARFGSPRTIISKEFPDEYNSDLIVISKTGLNPVERILMGAITDYVIRMARCDVMVVR
ncbi:universal stress protein [Liquorilactobacillus aquaticus DSM 21051]|uniref:Universal stress protein n=1 Tax=Liquorilactobacillus aquaticus DSM 21051 TaxID=1423725 RepID=A0A0R2CY23_9LACO|nr:universal stress protein [Liquorilactobacillus aquaticus]KRM96673.1 universal stress protein [Liquorilactobacillus aquaticus DSM 21051]